MQYTIWVWKWYYYGCYEPPCCKKTLISNKNHFSRIWELLKKDVAEGDKQQVMLTLSMLPYTITMDWADLWNHRNKN